MDNQEYGKVVAKELGDVLQQISIEEAAKLKDMILYGEEVFVAGAGRSGYMSRAFCMRLMHLGITCHMVGDTTTPAIKENDMLVICSGSGETSSLVNIAKKSKALGVKIALITSNDESTISQFADVLVRINVFSPKYNEDGVKSIQPMSSLFEQSLLLFLDIIIMQLMSEKGTDSKDMFARHTNLE